MKESKSSNERRSFSAFRIASSYGWLVLTPHAASGSIPAVGQDQLGLVGIMENLTSMPVLSVKL